MQAVFTHVALHVRDLDATIRFYTDYCGMRVAHDRTRGKKRIVWLAEPGREQEIIFVLLPGGPGQSRHEGDYSHLGFALERRELVDAVAARAEREGRLLWPPREEPAPVGYYCGVSDPDGNAVEFSVGQPLGPSMEPRKQTARTA